MTFHEWNMTRRDLMLQTALAGLLLAFPWADSAFAAVASSLLLKYLLRRTKPTMGSSGPLVKRVSSMSAVKRCPRSFRPSMVQR